MIKKFNVKKTRQLKKINRLLSVVYRKPCNKNTKPLKETQEILVIDFSLIGDMVMNIPFFRTIKKNCPQANIAMVCMPWAETVLGDQKLIDEFIIFDGKNMLSSPISVCIHAKTIRTTIKNINKKTYDMAIEAKGDLRHILFMHYTKSNRTISYNYTGGEYLITDSFLPNSETRNLMDEKIDLLELAGFEKYNEILVPKLTLSKEWKHYCEQFIVQNKLNGKIIIGLHPGASNSNKQFKYYPQLVSLIYENIRKNCVFVVFEAKGEEDLARKVCDVLPEENYIRVRRSLKEYVSLVSICDYMICNDSGVSHIAAAYDIPLLILYGANKAETALPKTKHVFYISHELDCKPCTLPRCPNGTEACIKGIQAKEAYTEAKKMMKDLLLS